MKKVIVAACIISLLLGLTWVSAAAPASLSLAWWSVDGGGQTFSQGGEYTLGGTAGQPDAGLLSGGGYTLGGGFWRGGAVVEVEHEVYLPLVIR